MLNSSIRRIVGRKAVLAMIAFAGATVAAGAAARANLSITPTFTSNFVTTSGSNATYFEGQIQDAINRVDSYIANNVTVNITFDAGGGLGASSSYVSSVTYNQYLTNLAINQTPSSYDATADATLPANNPVNSSWGIATTLPLLRAFGYNVSPPAGQPDSTISLNLALMATSSGGLNGSNYSIQSVAAHEIDEVLGIGGTGSTLGGQAIANTAGPLDLFRYSANGVRSYSTSAASSYFSINGGATDLTNFNQNSGADYSDWKTGATPQVQDAYGTPGVNTVLGRNELIALDVVGWNLTAAGSAVEVPEPATLGMLAIGGIALLTARRRTRK